MTNLIRKQEENEIERLLKSKDAVFNTPGMSFDLKLAPCREAGELAANVKKAFQLFFCPTGISLYVSILSLLDKKEAEKLLDEYDKDPTTVLPSQEQLIGRAYANLSLARTDRAKKHIKKIEEQPVKNMLSGGIVYEMPAGAHALLSVCYSLLGDEENASKIKKGIKYGIVGKIIPLSNFNPDETGGFEAIRMYDTIFSNALVAYMDYFNKTDADDRMKLTAEYKEYNGRQFASFKEEPSADDTLALAVALMAQEFYKRS